jgi:hypothetical protein
LSTARHRRAQASTLERHTHVERMRRRRIDADRMLSVQPAGAVAVKRLIAMV